MREHPFFWWKKKQLGEMVSLLYPLEWFDQAGPLTQVAPYAVGLFLCMILAPTLHWSMHAIMCAPVGFIALRVQQALMERSKMIPSNELSQKALLVGSILPSILGILGFVGHKDKIVAFTVYCIPAVQTYFMHYRAPGGYHFAWVYLMLLLTSCIGAVPGNLLLSVFK